MFTLRLSRLVALIIVSGLGSMSLAQIPRSIAFQGTLTRPDGAPQPDGAYPVVIRTYDAATGGVPLWTESKNVTVTKGTFSTTLSPLGLSFDKPYWIGVQVGTDPEMTPRLPLRSVPYALTAATAINSSNAWSLTGNAGTDPAAHFLGTTDNQPFEIKVNGQRSMRIEPATFSRSGNTYVGQNIVNGWIGNSVGPGIVVGATISGGGGFGLDDSPSPNIVTDFFGTIGGGSGNKADSWATVGGGSLNIASDIGSTVAGGWGNTASGIASFAVGTNNTAQGSSSVAAGGPFNIAIGEYSIVMGGSLSKASGKSSTVVGGHLNEAIGDASFAAGVRANAYHTGSFVWSGTSPDDPIGFGSTGPFQYLIRATGGVGINTSSPTSPLTVAGVVQSTSGGFQFPDGSVQTTAGLSSTTGWSLTGNAATDPATHFIGTTDIQPLELRVNDRRAVRYQYVESPNGVRSVNVLGGSDVNKIADGVIGATIAGGGYGYIDGFDRPNQITADYSTIGGGNVNTISGPYSVIGGGIGNSISDQTSFIGGGYGNVANGYANTISGGQSNRSVDHWATIGGGTGNTAGSDSTIGGGRANTATGSGSSIGGGGQNKALSRASTIAGGEVNTADGNETFIGGGYGNHVSGLDSVIAGGYYNTSGDVPGYVVASTIGGGSGNTTEYMFATIAGGAGNRATAYGATVAGGGGNTASGYTSSILGGIINTASGDESVVAGGSYNTAQGVASFAAGHGAIASRDGDFVWADSTGIRTGLTFDPGATPNTFAARASGGFLFYTNPEATTGATLASGSGSWSSLSDRNLKTGFAQVNGIALLDALAGIPVKTWNYKSQDSSVRHVGPMAQDFHAAFGVGEDDRHISSVDADGVALAAIQGLYQLVKEKDAKLVTQQRQIASLEARLSALEKGTTASSGLGTP